MPVDTPDESGHGAGSSVIPFPRSAGARRRASDRGRASMSQSGREEWGEEVSMGSEGRSASMGSAGEPGAGQAAEPAHASASGQAPGPATPREKFWNLPNTVTVTRVAVVPILLFLPWTMGVAGSRFMAWAFIIAAVTDILDGWLARRHGGRDITKIGKLLDPLADKLIVSTALIMLLAVGRIPLWGAGMVVVIVGRELAVTGLRGIAGVEGVVVAAGGAGKVKTVVQSAATAALLFHYETLGLPAHTIGMTLLALATALTLSSGYLYFRDYFGW